MKRLLILMTLLPAAAFSQTLFQEDFDGIPGPTAGGAGTYVFPAGWFLRNVDNRTPDAQTAYVNEAWERREDFNFNVTDSAAFSTSFYSPVGQADDWMWTPLIGPVTSGTVLRWNAVTYDGGWPDGYEVRVMTQASGPPTGGTGVLGNQVTNSTVIFSTGAENSSWTSHEISLAVYAGQSVYIGFRNNSTDKFLLVIDDVVVEHVVDYDLSVSAASRVSPYSILPLDQAAGQTELKATVTNYGLQSCTNVGIKCSVYLDGAFQETVTSTTIPSLAGSAGNEFTLPVWTPAQNGTYTFKFHPFMDQIDESADNDTMAAPFPLVIDPVQMARDYGPLSGQLGIGSTANGYLGQSFTFASPVYIDSIETNLAVGYAGTPYAAVIWSTDVTGEPTTILHATDTLIYPSNDAILARMGFANGPILLSPGTYVITQIEFDSTLAVGLTSDIFTTGKTFVDWPANPIPGWGNNEDFGAQFQKSYMIRPRFNLCQNVTYVTDTMLTQASCDLENGVAALTPAAGYSILWEDGTSSPVHDSLGAGYYIYTAFSQYCSFTDSVEITNPPAPTAVIDTIENALCFGGNGTVTLDIQSGTTPYEVIWSDGSVNETFTGPAGTYSATITDTNNCSVTVTDAVIAEPDEVIVATTIEHALCFGGNGTITLDSIQGGTAPYTATWPDSSTGEAYTAPAGTYDLAVLDGNNCPTVHSNMITEPAELDVTTSSTDETCNNCDDGTASVTPAGGTPPYVILWDNGDSGSPITDLAPGMYTATITDANGCDTVLTAEILPFDDASVTDLEQFGLSVFPNPAASQLFISNTSGKAVNVEMTDQAGRIVRSLSLNEALNPVDLSELATGIYTLRFVTPKGTASCKIVRQ